MAINRFLGYQRYAGRIESERNPGQFFDFDNVTVFRADDVQPKKDKNGNSFECSGVQGLSSLKIRMSDFEDVVGETFEEFCRLAPQRIMAKAVVFFDEKKGNGDPAVCRFRFVNPDGTIDL